MYTYNHIISRLPESQKIRLLTDIHSLTDPELESLGIPRVESAPLGGDDRTYPSLVSLARSWSPSLLRGVASSMGQDQERKGTNHLLLPPAGSALYSDGLRFSEDPTLSSTMAGAVLAGVNDAGVPATLTGYGFTRADARYMDTPPTERFLNEHLREPYHTALQNSSCRGILLEDHEPAPTALVEAGYTLFRRYASDRQTVICLARGELLMKGSAQALQRAVHNYRRLKHAIEHGKATTGELEESVALGEAMDEATLHQALDRLLIFAFACREGKGAGGTVPSATQQRPEAAAQTSPEQALSAATVLLQNDDELLPLRGSKKACLMGDWGDSEALATAITTLTAGGHTVIGHAPGYQLQGGRNDVLTREAASVASKAELVLVWLHAREGSRLPAEQLALMDVLSSLKKRVVVVLSADRRVDMDFATRAVTPPHAILLVPACGQEITRHVAETLLGLRTPAGRLTETWVDPTDPAAHRSGTKVGTFVGYRYYDTVGCGAVYPFGHGLTYTRMRYKGLKVTGNEISFTVKNVGRQTGVAVPQLYVGMERSAILRPRKELVAFTRLSLAPGETAAVTLPLRLPTISGTDAEIEQGTYTLFLGESSLDIRLTASVTGGNTPATPETAPLSAYIPVTNIHTEHYTLEAEYRPMKSSVRNIVFGIAALVLATSIKIYDIVTSSGSLFLNVVAVLMAVGAICFFLLEMRDRKKQFAQARAELEEATASLYEGADDIPMPSADAMFETAARVAAQEAEEEDDTILSNGVDHFSDVDKELTLPVAVKALTTLAAEDGLVVDESVARGIFAAMLSSRLILVKNTETELFESVCSLLGSYFECPVASDSVDESYTDELSLLFNSETGGQSARRNAAIALESARRNPRTIHLITLTNVTAETLSAYFVPYARYARSPLSACQVTARLEDGSDVVCRLPENLWFILNLREGERLDAIPDHIAEVAAVQTWHAGRTEAAAGRHSDFAIFRYGQLRYLFDRIRTETVTDEDVWKRVDRLESYGRRYGDFRMVNKLWTGMETYFSALRTYGVSTAEALDEAVAVMMMPSLIGALSGRIPQDERGLSDTLEAVLGDGNADLCRKTVKESGAELT